MKYKVYFMEWSIIDSVQEFSNLQEAQEVGKYWVKGKPTSRSYSIDVCK